MNIEELRSHLFIVIGYEHYNPLGVIRSLGENGIHPVVILLRSDVKVASKSKYIGKLFIVDSNEEAYQILIREYGNEAKKPFVIPCDDNITELLDYKYEELKDRFYVSNAGEAGRITYYMNKKNICNLAHKNGLNVAKSWVVKRGDIPSDLIYPIITKPLTSYPNWKADYRICESEEELKKAYREIKGTDLMLQQYIQKVNELCLDGISVNQGKEMLATISSTYTYILPDYFSLEMVITNFSDTKLQEKLQKMFQEVGYEGIFSLEFLVDAQGKLWFLEINFRNSTWSYASTKLGMNLPLLWATSMETGHLVKNAIKKVPKGYTALAEIDDYQHRVKRLKLINFGEWVKGIKHADCLYYWSKEDKHPYFSYWFGKILRVTKKKLHLYKGDKGL